MSPLHRFWKPACTCVLLVLLALWPSAPDVSAVDKPKRDELAEALIEAFERISELEDKLACVHAIDGEINGLAGPHLIIEGCNVHVRSATGDTDVIDGTGNLIVGYNELFDGDESRDGSHNLVVGRGHEFSNYGGLVAGETNSVTGAASTVSGGQFNLASGFASSVTGGGGMDGGTVLPNVASGDYSSVSGGTRNTSSGTFASVSGGFFNAASGTAATVSGGFGFDADQVFEFLP